MKRSGLFKVSYFMVFIGFLITMICITLMFALSYPDVKTYYEAIKENEDGDIVYIYGQVLKTGTTSRDQDYIELVGVESASFLISDKEAIVSFNPYIYFEDDIDFEDDVDYVLIKGKIIGEDINPNYIEGQSVEYQGQLDHIGSLYYDPGFLNLALLTGLPLVIIGGLLFFFGYQKTMNQILKPESELMRKKSDALPTLILFIGLILVLFYPLFILGFLLFITSIILQTRLMKNKLRCCQDEENDKVATRLKTGIRVVKISAIFLFIFCLIFGIYSLFRSTGIGDTEPFMLQFYVSTVFLTIGILLYATGINVDTRKYSPIIENKLSEFRSFDRKKWIFISFVGILIITGIFIPVFVNTLLPSAVAMDEQYFNSIDDLEEGDELIINDEIIDYEEFGDKTYIILSEMLTNKDEPRLDGENKYYTTIIFEGDIRDEIPYRGSRVLIHAVVVTKTRYSGNQPYEIIYIKGKSMDFYYEYTSGYFLLALITTNVIILLISVYCLKRLKSYQLLIDKISKNGEITETDSIHEAIVIDLVTCPRCNKNFEISTDTKIMKCPHCGISGLVKK